MKLSNNIYNDVKIVYDENKKVFSVMNINDITNWFTIEITKDLDTAVAIKKAYCAGYYDGSHSIKEDLSE